MRFETSDINADIAESGRVDLSSAVLSLSLGDSVSDLAVTRGKEFEEPSTVALHVDNI